MRLSTKIKISIKANVDIYFREQLFLKNMENLNQILRKFFSTPNFTVIAIHASRELYFLHPATSNFFSKMRISHLLYTLPHSTKVMFPDIIYIKIE